AHVLVSRRGLETGPVDEALAALGLLRNGVATVGGFASAIALAGASDLVATVPEKHTRGLCFALHDFALPMPVPGFTVSMFWHPRMDADPAHRWLRGLFAAVCRDGAC